MTKIYLIYLNFKVHLKIRWMALIIGLTTMRGNRRNTLLLVIYISYITLQINFVFSFLRGWFLAIERQIYTSSAWLWSDQVSCLCWRTFISLKRFPSLNIHLNLTNFKKLRNFSFTYKKAEVLKFENISVSNTIFHVQIIEYLHMTI